jgi:UDP-N-acetyl-D-glucosamine dehydrogenase
MTNEKFSLPDEEVTRREVSMIRELADAERRKGKKIVVVQGLGFVGAVMSAIVADCETDGKAPYYVIGIDLPTAGSYWKIPMINRGESPLKAEDPEIEKIFSRIKQKENIRASWVEEAYQEADIIIVDVNLDVVKKEIGKAENASVKIDSFKKAVRAVARGMRPDALLLIETTVPPGTVEYIVKPIVLEAFRQRGISPGSDGPLIAYSYERVMPGDKYVMSIKKMWRSYAATSPRALEQARRFLASIIDTEGFPLYRLDSTTAAEMGKILENSYRAMNIAFIHEWTMFAEDAGINLFEVVNSIRVRKGTHDNMMLPGFGVGGYCLTKDTILADWASRNIFHRKDGLKFSVEAINVNDLMPHHTFDLLKKGKPDLAGKKIAILGASYRKDVDDTRNSPTISLYDDIRSAGGIPCVHDPYATVITGREDIIVTPDLEEALKRASAVVMVVNHRAYKELSAAFLMGLICPGSCIVDAFDILTDDKIVSLKKNGHTVEGVGKGHIRFM